MLGSAYYAAHPLFPLANTVADLNSDVLTTLGPMRDFTVAGYGQSELDDYARTATKEQNRYVQPDPEPELGHFYRSDHFSFAKVGVPVLCGGGYYDSRLHSKASMEELVSEYHAKHYHQPSDEYDAQWNLRGAEQDVRLLFRVGQRLTSETTFPQWKSGSGFKAIREKSRPGQQEPMARLAAGAVRAQE
ncbi:hypothetical protein DDQ68_06525 [Hymenobacter nivis]|uniref:Peptidase M28 domain-containing protein n=1 Tax=Hymenobacter nivis TaxID=1850093 RepID=A0A2Z3GSY1_9BACT|nr:hypothetical protein DDQ68_06525 [Hymenobacter nivis]